jgi:hypothetical protein
MARAILVPQPRAVKRDEQKKPLDMSGFFNGASF